jgi:hypothetical protein
MGGRRDDNAPARGWLVRGLGLGLVPAAGAAVAVFFTDDARLLRVAVLALCWAFVAAALLAGSRRTDQVVARGREAELRHAYDLELEREVAARHEYERELEGRLRREAEDAMRGELARLHRELAGLGQLRSEIAALAEIRGALAGLDQLRAELTGLAELRSDLGSIRSELTEQLSGELLVERMVMRAQSVRGPVQAGGGWDVDRWSEIRAVPAEPVEAAPLPIARPPVPPPAARPSASVDARPQPRSPLEWLGDRSLLDADDQPTGEFPVVAEPEPAEAPSYAAPSYDGARYDELLFGSSPVAEASYEEGYRPSSWATGGTSWSAENSTAYDASGYAAGSPSEEPSPRVRPGPSGHARLEQILAESGVDVPSGGRARRRRHRDEDDEAAGDDVLARVLGRSP